MSLGNDPAARPDAHIEGLLASHRTLTAWVTRLTDAQVSEPSSLPGWSRGHTMTHIARNADSVTRRLEGAARDEVVDQYVGGTEGRAREIEEGSVRSAAELIADVIDSAERVDAAIAAMPVDAWGRLGRSHTGVESPVSGLPLGRWREAEIHLVDLAIGYGPADWPDAFVEANVDSAVRSLKHRTDPRALLGWAIDRLDAAPELSSWGG